MKIGIKYCGGCNVNYDRVSFVKSITEEHPTLNFTPANEKTSVDYLLVVCGCNATCAGIENLKRKNGHFFVKGWDAKETVNNRINHMKQIENNAITNKIKLEANVETTDSYTLKDNELKRFSSILSGNLSPSLTLFNIREIEENTLLSHIDIWNFLLSKIKLRYSAMRGEIISEHIKYGAIPFCGETITSNIQLLSFSETDNYYIANFICKCVNAKLEMVVATETSVNLNKKYVEITQP